MLTLYLRRNLSETATPLNIVLRQWPDDGARTETTTGQIFWRYEDEPNMVPQFWRDAVVGFETAGPLDTNGRNIRLYFIGYTGLDTPNAQSFAEAEQKVVYMTLESDAVTFMEEEVTFASDPLLFSGGSSPYLTFTP